MLTALFLFLLFGLEATAIIIAIVMYTYEKYFKEEHEAHVAGERIPGKF